MPCPGAPGGKCNFDASTETCNGCKLLCRPCTFTDVSTLAEKMKPGEMYSALGVSPSIQHGNKGNMLHKIEAPFNPNLQLDAVDENLVS